MHKNPTLRIIYTLSFAKSTRVRLKAAQEFHQDNQEYETQDVFFTHRLPPFLIVKCMRVDGLFVFSRNGSFEYSTKILDFV